MRSQERIGVGLLENCKLTVGPTQTCKPVEIGSITMFFFGGKP